MCHYTSVADLPTRLWSSTKMYQQSGQRTGNVLTRNSTKKRSNPSLESPEKLAPFIGFGRLIVVVNKRRTHKMWKLIGQKVNHNRIAKRRSTILGTSLTRKTKITTLTKLLNHTMNDSSAEECVSALIWFGATRKQYSWLTMFYNLECNGKKFLKWWVTSILHKLETSFATCAASYRLTGRFSCRSSAWIPWSGSSRRSRTNHRDQQTEMGSANEIPQWVI